MLLAISGKIGSGKDLTGKIVQAFIDFPKASNEAILTIVKSGTDNSSVQIMKFADTLKDMVCLLLNCTRKQLEDTEFKNKELGEDWWYYTNNLFSNEDKELVSYLEANTFIHNSPKWYIIKLTPRFLLQLLGTDCGRNIIHPNIWCTSLMNKYIGDIEEWKDIETYENLYQISSFGNVKSLDRLLTYGSSKGEYHNRKGQLLKPTLSNGYLTVSLSNKTFTVHDLVGRHFCDKSNENFVLNHKDYDKTNNFYRNLEYIIQGDNVRHNYKSGKANIGIKQKDAKLTDELASEIKFKLKRGDKQADLAREYQVSPTTICDIKKERKWNHIEKDFIVPIPILPVSPPNWVITDMRFPNELQAVKDRGGISIRVARQYSKEDLCKGSSPIIRNEDLSLKLAERYKSMKDLPVVKIHESETALDEYGMDHFIKNDGTIEELIEKVKQILTKEKII